MGLCPRPTWPRGRLRDACPRFQVKAEREKQRLANTSCSTSQPSPTPTRGWMWRGERCFPPTPRPDVGWWSSGATSLSSCSPWSPPVLSPVQREERPAQIQLCAGGLRECQDQPQRQLQSLWQVHGHQLQLQRRAHRRAHQQLSAGEGEKAVHHRGARERPAAGPLG